MNNNKLKNRLRIWLSLFLIILLYGSFMVYFCMARPSEPNNIVIEQEKTTEKNTSTAKTVGPEVYLCEITAFYQQIITILFGVIGILLALSFAYMYFTSKRQAEDMARDALKDESFIIKLDKMIYEHFIKARDEGDISDIFEVLDEIDGRIKFLENAITEKGYISLKERSLEEKTDGNN